MRSVPLMITLATLVAGAALADDRNPPRPPQMPADATATAGAEKAAPVPGEAAEYRLEARPEAVDAVAATSQHAAMMTELRLAREDEMRQVGELTAALEQAASNEERQEIQRRIVDVKSAGVAQSMTIQLNYARAAGLADQVRKLEADLEQFTALRTAPRAPQTTATERRVQNPGGAAR